MRSRLILLALPAFVLLVLVASGCGGGGSSSTTTAKKPKVEEKPQLSKAEFITQGDGVCVEEVQHVVYRDSRSTSASPPTHVDPTDASRANDWSVAIDPTMLFRFSALTKNAHRIHYDLAYARDVEGYGGLVIHGPLQALIMAEAARSSGAT